MTGVVGVDKFSCEGRFYGGSSHLCGSFELAMRKVVGAGSRRTAPVCNAPYDIDPTGGTSALLKVQECGRKLSGWTPASCRAGALAFK